MLLHHATRSLKMSSLGPDREIPQTTMKPGAGLGINNDTQVNQADSPLLIGLFVGVMGCLVAVGLVGCYLCFRRCFCTLNRDDLRHDFSSKGSSVSTTSSQQTIPTIQNAVDRTNSIVSNNGTQIKRGKSNKSRPSNSTKLAAK